MLVAGCLLLVAGCWAEEEDEAKKREVEKEKKRKLHLSCRDKITMAKN